MAALRSPAEPLELLLPRGTPSRAEDFASGLQLSRRGAGIGRRDPRPPVHRRCPVPERRALGVARSEDRPPSPRDGLARHRGHRGDRERRPDSDLLERGGRLRRRVRLHRSARHLLALVAGAAARARADRSAAVPFVPARRGRDAGRRLVRNGGRGRPGGVRRAGLRARRNVRGDLHRRQRQLQRDRPWSTASCRTVRSTRARPSSTAR